MELRLLDCENDFVNCKYEETQIFEDIEHAKRCIIQDFRHAHMSEEYMPFRLVDTDSHRQKNHMTVHAEIKKMYMTLDIEERA